MKISMMKVGELRGYERNAKKHPEEQVAKIAASIKEFGFNQPLVIDKDGVIVVGHGRFLAAKALELETVPCLMVEGLSKEQINAYRLADNKLNEFPWDMDLVFEELAGMGEELASLTGFDISMLRVGNAISDIDDVQVDPEKMQVIEVFPPESPRLKEKFWMVCYTKEEYDDIKEALESGALSSKEIAKLVKK